MWHKLLAFYYTITNPLISLLVMLRITPTQVTISGLTFSIISGVAYASGHLTIALLFFIIAGICDTFDGQLARRIGTASAWGAFLDSTLDRLAETAVHLGLAYYFLSQQPHVAMLAIVSLIAAYMVSYTRARAEGLGIACNVGVMQRPHRFLVLTFGSMAGYQGIAFALIIILIFSIYTVGQRIITVRKGAEV